MPFGNDQKNDGDKGQVCERTQGMSQQRLSGQPDKLLGYGAPHPGPASSSGHDDACLPHLCK
jgi:hypothetical protein